MAIFIIVPATNAQGIKAALSEQKIDHIDLPAGGFFVSYPGTAIELSGTLGITNGTSGTGVIGEISSYYGRASTDIWDWVKSRWEA